MILFIKHIVIEGPGLLGDYFRNRGYSFRISDVSAGEPLPASFRNTQAVVILGGPMNVYETDKYPFLSAEDEFIRKTIAARIPIMGICLGGQLIAKALGARVRKNPSPEIGFYKTALKPAGQSDPVFGGLKNSFTVFQWHGDTFDIPGGAQALASSKLCANQAFSYDDFVYGLQFHVEVDVAMIAQWCGEYHTDKDAKLLRKARKLQAEYIRHKKELNNNLEIIASGFEKVIKKAEKRKTQK